MSKRKKFMKYAIAQISGKQLKKTYKQFKNMLLRLYKKAKRTGFLKKVLEKSIITLLYFFITIFLLIRAKSLTGRASGLAFDTLPLFSYAKKMPIFQIFARPESTFILYSTMMRPITSSSKFVANLPYLVRFNLLLVLLIEMVQLLFLDYWSVLFRSGTLNENIKFRKINLAAYSILFGSFLALYLYCYVIAMLGKIPSFPGIFNTIPLSAQYWLKSKVIEDKKNKN